MKRYLLVALLVLAGACTPAHRNIRAQVKPPAIQEDDPGWNCLTMGNRKCGPQWETVSPELADALAEGAAPDATVRDWESCLVRYGDTTYVVCPDGHVETS